MTEDAFPPDTVVAVFRTGHGSAAPTAPTAARLYAELADLATHLAVDGDVVTFHGGPLAIAEIRRRIASLLLEERFAGWSLAGTGHPDDRIRTARRSAS